MNTSKSDPVALDTVWTTTTAAKEGGHARQDCCAGPGHAVGFRRHALSIYTQPPTDWSKVTNLGQMRAVPEVRNTVNLAQQYAELGYDPDALISRLATIVVHDNFTGMHAFKHHQATFEEFHATRLPWRWRHLVSAAQASAISYGKNMEIYEEALELLHA